MERKIGEIFEHEGEWYQCVKGNTCDECSFNKSSWNCLFDGTPYCSDRSDEIEVIFKKLEKVGEPYTLENKKFQKYRVFHTPYIYNKTDCSWQSFADPYYIGLEVKQNKKEVMYIHKVAMNIDDRDYLLDKLESVLHDTHCQQYKDEICEAFSKYITTESVPDLKSFDLNAAKAGKPVCTRNGKKARIICFDRAWDMPIVALVSDPLGESVHYYLSNGKIDFDRQFDDDLMMLPEKKEGWVNLYKRENEYICENECNVYIGIAVYKSEGEAKRNIDKNEIYINTIKITWEE